MFGESSFPSGTGGGDQLDGGTGDDVLNGGFAADVLIGADGFDAADYASATSPLTITINNVANDGTPGEGDNVRTTVESILGGQSTDTISGGPGANALFGGAAADAINGGGGNDLLDGEIPGRFDPFVGDTLAGGAGTDTVSYASHSFGVTADPDNAADDGQIGENDNVRSSVENLFGGPSGDTLTGTAGSNVLDGGNSSGSDSDILTGMGSADFIAGGRGNDTANGDAGNDRIRSRGDAGFVDTNNCGADTDTVQADPADVLNDCENVFNAGALVPVEDSGLEDQWRRARQALRRAQVLVEAAR